MLIRLFSIKLIVSHWFSCVGHFKNSNILVALACLENSFKSAIGYFLTNFCFGQSKFIFGGCIHQRLIKKVAFS